MVALHERGFHVATPALTVASQVLVLGDALLDVHVTPARPLRVNIGLIINNARTAGAIAAALT